MCGPSIVGYASYRYIYESGRTAEAPLAGFAIRGRELVIYLVAEGRRTELIVVQAWQAQDGKSLSIFQAISLLSVYSIFKLTA
jgi:hypothetical protein